MSAPRKTISDAAFRRLWLDNTLSRAQIGAMLDITPSAVTGRARRRGLPARSGERSKRHNRSITLAEMLPLWLALVSTAGIAKHFGVECEAVHSAASRLKMPKRNSSRWKSITLEQYRAGEADRLAAKRADDKAEFVAMWRAGVSATDLSALLGIDDSNVYARAARAGLSRKGIAVISLSTYRQQVLAQRMACAAVATRDAMLGRDMVDRRSAMWERAA